MPSAFIIYVNEKFYFGESMWVLLIVPRDLLNKLKRAGGLAVAMSLGSMIRGGFAGIVKSMDGIVSYKMLAGWNWIYQPPSKIGKWNFTVYWKYAKENNMYWWGLKLKAHAVYTIRYYKVGTFHFKTLISKVRWPQLITTTPCHSIITIGSGPTS